MITMEGGGHGGFGSEELNVRIRAYFDRTLRKKDVKISETPIKTQPRRR